LLKLTVIGIGIEVILSTPVMGARIIFPITDVRPIINSELESRLLLDFEVQGLESKWISSAYLHLPIPGVASPEDLEIQPCTVSTAWRGRNATWTSPWRNPGGDLDVSSPSITLEKEQIETSVRINVTDEIRAIVRGERSAYGLALSVPEWKEEEGFTLAERSVLGSLAGASLVVTYTNAIPKAARENVVIGR
jgi:hypothetical protein